MSVSKINYSVILENGYWKYITDGFRVYKAAQDLRYYARPPEISNHSNFINDFGPIHKDTELVEIRNKYNRIELLPISYDEFINYEKLNNSDIRIPPSFFSKIKKIIKYAAVLCTVGYMVTMKMKIGQFDPGYIGISGGLLISIYFSSGSEYSLENLQKIFEHAVKLDSDWKNFESKVGQLIATDKQNFIEKAKKEWNKYFRIKNILNLTQTIDFDKMTGEDFELFLKDLYERKGYKAELTSKSSDYGIDLLATKGSERLGIQAKRYTGTVGLSAIQEVVAGAKYYNTTKSMVITNSNFSKNAISLAEKNDVTLIDRDSLLKLVYSIEVTKFQNDVFSLDRYLQLEPEIKKFLRYEAHPVSRRRRYF